MVERPVTDATDLPARVLGWLSPDQRDPASVSQYEAQQLAWYTAPHRWSVPVDQLPEVADTCARLLETAGRPRAAAALREHTPEVTAGWARSTAHGYAARNRAMQATGVEPPDTPTLSWGSIMGTAEAKVLDAAQRMLEAAIDAGTVTPGRRSWSTAQRRVVEDWLRAPSPRFAGQPPLDVVHTERTEHWLKAGTPARETILRAALPHLRGPAEPATGSLEPLLFLLGSLDRGVTLLPNGWLPLAFVQDVAARYGWGLPAFRIRHEGHVTELGELRDLATRTHLIIRRRRPHTLLLTPEGQAALAEPERLWHTAAAGWFDLDDFASYVAEIAAALLLEGPASTADLATTAHEAVAASFCDLDGAHPSYREVRTALGEWLRPGHVLGWLRYPQGTAERLHQLTEAGRAGAVEGLRHRSRAPLR